MFIDYNSTICFISKISEPYKFRYHIRADLERYGNDYIKEKLGVTDPDIQKQLQNEFYKATKSYKKSKQNLLERHTLRYLKTDFSFYLTDITPDSATIYFEKGLDALYPGKPRGLKNPPHGCPWAVIYKTDTPEIIQAKLYDAWKSFGVALHRKLKKIMGW
ncbi:MAG: hypothetical protein J7K40_02520 [candidate division Zixibacteria bacterium]|nr:hypothetical protein [candidate division Zixibacteria bacterium]